MSELKNAGVGNISDLSHLFVRANDPNAPTPVQQSPNTQPQDIVALEPQPAPMIPQHTPAGWTGDRTQVHGYPLPPTPPNLPPSPEAKWGRYELPHPETGEKEKFSRATTLAGSLDNGGGLTRWLQRNIVHGLKRDPDLLDDIDLLGEPREVNKDIDRVIEEAGNLAGACDASEKGTAIHAWTEAVERDGVPIDQVPREFRSTVQAYIDALARAGITTVPGMVERLVWNKETNHVGTFDRLYQLADGSHVIGDVKTSKVTSLKYSWLSFAMQTALYANADCIYNPATGQWEPMPEVGKTFAVIAHIPSDQPGTAQLITVDLGIGQQAIDMALDLDAMRSQAGNLVPNHWELPQPKAQAPAVDLNALIDSCSTANELAALWEEHQAVWTDEHTARGQARLTPS